MASENENEKERKLVPFLWFGGILLTGALLTFIILYCRQGKMTNEARTRLAEIEAALTGERDSLAYELSMLSKDYDTIRTNFTNLQSEFRQLTDKNKQLAASNMVIAREAKKFRDENASLNQSLTGKQATIEALEQEIGLLQAQLDGVKKEKEATDMSNAALARNLEEKEAQIKADSIKKAEEMAYVPPKESGFTNITELSGAVGLIKTDVPYSKYYFGITNVFGYDINRHFLAGLGLGVYSFNGGVMLPLYFDFRYTFNDRPFTPYLFGDGGVLFNIDQFDASCLFVNPGIGIKHRLSDKLALNFGTGLFTQMSPVIDRSSFINFKLGLTFKGKR